MNEQRVPEQLIGQITRSAEMLAACERTMRSSHAWLAAAHYQIERARDLQRQIEILNHLHDPSIARHDAWNPIDPL